MNIEKKANYTVCYVKLSCAICYIHCTAIKMGLCYVCYKMLYAMQNGRGCYVCL